MTNILLADDEELLLKAYNRFLPTKDFNVASFTNPDDALETVKKSEKVKWARPGGRDYFDYAFSDFDFGPGRLTGLSFVERLHRLSPGTKIAVITSAYIDDELNSSLTQAGALWVFSKGTSFRDILTQVGISK